LPYQLIKNQKMKKIILFSVVIIAVLGTAQAQQNSTSDSLYSNVMDYSASAPTQGWKLHQDHAKLVISTYVERTHIGPKGGTSLGVEFRNLMSLGVFYQESDLILTVIGSNDNTEMPAYYEKQFYGIYYTVPIHHQGLVGFDFKLRTGISNGENFVITPSVHSTIKLARYVELGGGVGMRAFRPTVMSSIKIKL
jgi:hypothetical protein